MSTPVIGFEEDMSDTGRDYGQEAMLRRLGLLAKTRREELGFGRAAFAKHAGVGSDKTIMQFEYGKLAPRTMTLRRIERALGWRQGSVSEFMEDETLKVSDVRMEDLDSYDAAPPATLLDDIPTPVLLEVLIKRLSDIQASIGGKPTPAPTRDMLGLAASGGHKPEHLDEDPDDDLSSFNPSDN